METIRIILGGISPEYEFAMQRLIDFGLENKCSDELTLKMLIETIPELKNYGYSGAQFFYCLWFLRNSLEKGYNNFIDIGLKQVERDRIFIWNQTIESIKNSEYKFSLTD